MKQLLVITVIFSSLLSAMKSNDQQEWDGKYYQRNSRPQYLAGAALLRTLDLSQHSAIIDIGCGSGELTAEIARLAPQAQVVGIDPNEKMISVARQTHAGNPRLSFLLQDAQKEFPFSDRFDFAFSSAVFLWIPDKKAAFDNINKVLKRGGSMVIKATQPLAADHPLKLALAQLAKKPKWFPVVQEYQRTPQIFPLALNEMQQLITHEKWENIVFADNPTTYQFNTKQELSAWLAGWMKALPAIGNLTPGMQASFIEEFTDEYVKFPVTQTENGIKYFLTGLLIKAQKK